jgi:N utilization substance protein B
LWELKKGDPAASIVINEAIELAKCFAEKDAYKFINGVLDESVKALGLQPAE